MDAGRLNRKIFILAKSVTHNSYNEPIDVWSTKRSVYSEVITTGGGEFYAAQKLNESTSCLFKIRYTNRIKSTNRIKYGNRTFEILSLNDVDGTHEELRISAREVS